MDARERDILLGDLAHADEEVRRLAVERLSTLPAEEATPHLVRSLGDSGWRVRKAAIDRLVASPALPSATHALVEALADGGNPGRRNAALEALVRTGTVAIPILIEASRSEDVDVRKQAVDVLAGIGSLTAESRLVELLVDADANVRAAAADALGVLGGTGVAADLKDRLDRDDEPLVRLSALRALARLDVSLRVLDLEGALADPILRATALGTLGASDDDAAFDALVKALESNARSAREAAVGGILDQAARVGPEALEIFRERLREKFRPSARFLEDAFERVIDAPLETRLALVQFMGLARVPGATGPLLTAGCDEALSSSVLEALLEFGTDVDAEIEAAWEGLEPPGRALACELLGRSTSDAGTPRLRAALSAQDVFVRIAASRALAARCAEEALADLIGRLEIAPTLWDGEDADEERVLAEAIVEIVGGAGQGAAAAAVALLETRLENAEEPFRFAATELLCAIGRAEDAPLVERLFSDPSERVRRAAITALVSIAPDCTEAIHLAMADESRMVRIGVAIAIAASDRADVLSDLATLAEDSDVRVRASAMRAIGTWVTRRDPDEAVRDEALALLAAGLGRGGMVALATIESLRGIGGSAAVALTHSALASQDAAIVEAAIGCIGEHGSRQDVEAVAGLFTHHHWTVRARAIEVAASRRAISTLPAMLRCLESERDEFAREALLKAVSALESLAG